MPKNCAGPRVVLEFVQEKLQPRLGFAAKGETALKTVPKKSKISAKYQPKSLD